VRQFSPAVIVNVIALWPPLPWTAADHPGAWRGPPTCTYARARRWSTPLAAAADITCHFWRLQHGGLVTDHGQTAWL